MGKRLREIKVSGSLCLKNQSLSNVLVKYITKLVTKCLKKR